MVKGAKVKKIPAAKQLLPLGISIIVAIILFFIKPLGMDTRQSLILSALVLVIIWWSTGIVSKIFASSFLILIFFLFGNAPVKTVLSFPLSENFLMIVLCYLFSQGIKKSRIAEKTLEPFLFHRVDTPFKTLCSIILVFFLAMYMIPQPLARLIIIADVYRSFLRKTNATVRQQGLLCFAIFEFYAIINAASLDADIIFNTAAVSFSGAEVTSGEWASYMTVPTLVYTILVLALFCAVFRKELFHIRLTPLEGGKTEKKPLTSGDKRVLCIICGTVLLWSTSQLHGISPVIITLLGTAFFFCLRVLHAEDFHAIDVSTLLFLTAAFSIGGVMKASGIAEIIFSRVAPLFPKALSPWYILTIILTAMVMHLVLGSNTTTMSVVLPGLVAICGAKLSSPVILYIVYLSLTSHHLLPFHSVAMMIGVGNDYFSPKLVTKFGVPMMLLIIAVIFGVYLPWWRFCGFVI